MHFTDGVKKQKNMSLERGFIMRDIKGYEGEYAITSCGRVWSYKSNKFLKPGNHRDGYLVVGLCKYGKRHNAFIHRLVAEAYIQNTDNLNEINHKDEVKTHNWISNLEWCDHSYNINYGTRTQKTSTKVKCLETGQIFDSLMECERETGCRNGNISLQIRGLRKSVNGYHFIKVE